MESFHSRAGSTRPLRYCVVPDSISNIQRKSTHQLPPPTGVSGPNQSQRHWECQGRTGSVSQRLEGRLLASQGSPAGNPALYPGWISLDCKIYAVLLCNLRAFEKERKGVGRGALNGGKYFHLHCYHFWEKPGRLKGLPRLGNSSSYHPIQPSYRGLDGHVYICFYLCLLKARKASLGLTLCR